MVSQRDLLLVTLARFVSRLGGTAVFFVGTWGTAAYHFGATPTQLALLSAGSSVAAIASSAICGVLIDRFGPRRVMVVAELLTIPAVLGMMRAPTLPVFAVLAVAFTFVGIPTYTAGEAFAPYLTSDRTQFERVNAYLEAAGSSGFVLGPAAGAIVSRSFGLPNVFWIMVVASLVASAFAWAVRIDESPRNHEGGAFTELVAGVRLVYSLPPVRFTVLMGSVVWLGFGFFSALEPLFYRDAVGAGVEWIGWMNTLFGVGMVAGAALLTKLPQRVVSATGLALVSAAVGLGTLLYVGSTDLRLIAVGAACWGVLIGIAGPLLRTLLQLDTPHEYVGRVMGASQYHRSAGELLPLAVAPALAAAFGVQRVLIGGGLAVAVIALAALPVAVAVERGRVAARAPGSAGGPGSRVTGLDAIATAIAEEPAHHPADRIG